MELTDTQTLVTVCSGVAIVLGIAGIVLPVLPALPVCWAGVLVWTLFGGAGGGRWVVLAVATLLAVGGTVVKYLLPGRNLRRSGLPNGSLLAGGLLGVVGFFVVPVVGLILGFVLGIFLAELVRLQETRLAWPSTVNAVKAAGLAMMIELAAGLGILAVWLGGLVWA